MLLRSHDEPPRQRSCSAPGRQRLAGNRQFLAGPRRRRQMDQDPYARGEDASERTSAIKINAEYIHTPKGKQPHEAPRALDTAEMLRAITRCPVTC